MVKCAGAICYRRGRLLLGLRASHKSYPLHWDIIGGHIEPGETPWVALTRELSEEIGIDVLAGKHMESWSMIGTLRQPISLHLYLVTNWIGEPAIRNSEHLALQWFQPSRAACLPNLALPRYRAMFRSLI